MADEDDDPANGGANDADIEQGDEGSEGQDDQLSEIDQLAAEMGWKPKAQWDGDEAEWADSRTFLKKTREINRSQGRELKDLKRQIEGIGRATSRMTDLALKQQREEILRARKEAIADGDEAAVDAADKALREIEVPHQRVEPEEVTAFKEKHRAWFGVDQEATDWAATRSTELAKAGVTSVTRQLQIIEREAKTLFPEHFPQAKKQPALGAPQRTVSTTPREKGYATLPPTAKKACDEWVRTQQENGNKWATKDAWAGTYYEQEAANG